MKKTLALLLILFTISCGEYLTAAELQKPLKTKEVPKRSKMQRSHKSKRSHHHSSSHCKTKKFCKAEVEKAEIDKAEIENAEISIADIEQATIFQATIGNAEINTEEVSLLCAQRVNYPVGDTYTIGVDLPTIQSGIDIANTGLKPDAKGFCPSDPTKPKDVILIIPSGTYNESLFIDTTFSDPEANGPGSDLVGKETRGLRLIGDTRPIASMTYLNGGLIETASPFTVNSGLNSLGSLNSVVTLSNVGNTITVTVNTGNAPNFSACGVVAGDIIVVTDKDGTFQERNVISVLNNTVTYDGAPVTVSGLGAALTFCPNVHVIGSQPDFICWVTSGQVEMIGIRLSYLPSILPTNAGYGLFISGTGLVWASRVMVDSRAADTAALFTFTGGQMVIGDSDGFITDHFTILGGRIEPGFNSQISFGNIYALARPHQVLACVRHEDSSRFFVNSLQVNGANSTTAGYRTQSGNVAQLGVFSAFNCSNGISSVGDSNISIASAMNINSCTTGINLSAGRLTVRGSGTFAGLTPTIKNSTTAVLADLGAQYYISRPLVLDTCTTGFNLTNASRFASKANVTLTSVTNHYAIDEGSVYTTDQNTGTDPSPSNIFTYSTAGSVAMNSAYLRQLLDSGGVVNIQLTPGLSIASTRVYRGKVFTLTKVSGGNHTVTLTGATFLDGTTVKTFTGPVGSTMTIQIDSDTSVAILTSNGVT